MIYLLMLVIVVFSSVCAWSACNSGSLKDFCAYMLLAILGFVYVVDLYKKTLDHCSTADNCVKEIRL